MSIEEAVKAGEAIWVNVKIKSFPYLVGCVAFFLLCAALLSLLYVKSLKDAEKNRIANRALEAQIVAKDYDLKKLRGENDAKTKALVESVKKYQSSLADLDRISSFYSNSDWRVIARDYQLRTGKN